MRSLSLTRSLVRSLSHAHALFRALLISRARSRSRSLFLALSWLVVCTMTLDGLWKSPIPHMYTVHTGSKDLDNLLLDIDCSLIHCTLDLETEACAALYAVARQAPVCYAPQLHIM